MSAHHSQRARTRSSASIRAPRMPNWAWAYGQRRVICGQLTTVPPIHESLAIRPLRLCRSPFARQGLGFDSPRLHPPAGHASTRRSAQSSPLPSRPTRFLFVTPGRTTRVHSQCDHLFERGRRFCCARGQYAGGSVRGLVTSCRVDTAISLTRTNRCSGSKASSSTIGRIAATTPARAYARPSSPRFVLCRYLMWCRPESRIARHSSGLDSCELSFVRIASNPRCRASRSR
ncbi:hypothetical protein SAMN05444157_0418 [Frankineae bacterium MT45]|nr:hypothetical protein SAMN05444157_0418 [Frankineae bacterium MT45]